MRLTILSLCLLFSSASYAKKLIVANCEMGGGCTFQISEADAGDYDMAEGNSNGYYENLPENAILVDVKIDGKWEQYVETKMTRSQLDKFYGGDGFTMLYPFNPNFQPLDGRWQITIGTVTGDICYGQESNMFKSMLQGLSQSGEVNFPQPFHARFLMNNPNVKWQRISPDRYKAFLGNDYLNLRFDVQLMSDRKIEGWFTVTIKVPTKEPCINKIPITYICVKPKEWKDPWEDLEEPEPEDDLLPVNPKDDLLPVEPGKNPKPNVPRLDDPKPDIPRLEDNPRPNVPLLEDKPKTNIPRLEN